MQHNHLRVDGCSCGRAARLLQTLVAFFACLLPLAAWAAKSVPDCRLDDELVAPVRIAAQWGLEGLKATGRPLNFDTVAINPRRPVPARTLRIEVVKDATLKTVDAKGCIKPFQYIMEGATLRSDGSCQATRLKDCNAADRDYMRQRYEQIAGIGTGDTQTGYEKSGACYMTNQQACIHHQRMALLDALGQRDALSVKGACIANAAGPVHIRCSAGALKMLRNSESVEYKATTIAMVLVIGHELGHLLASESSSFEVGDNAIDLQWSSENKMARLEGLCTSGESRRERERAADEVGLSLARQRLPEVARLWPKQGTTGWMVTQAIHQSTNLTRWNNDWRDAAPVRMSEVFRVQANGGIIEFDEKDIDDIESGRNVSGRSAQQVRGIAQRFLCELAPARSGHQDVTMLSGSTHGTMVERIGELAAALRPVKGNSANPFEDMEAMIGKMGDLVMLRHRAYLRELEGAMCTLVAKPLDCSDAALKAAAADAAPSKPARKSGREPARGPDVRPKAPESAKLEVDFKPQGPYRDVTDEPAAFTLAIGSYRESHTMEQALAQGREIAAAYESLLREIDGRLKAHGGAWLYLPSAEGEVSYNRFAESYLAHVNLRAVVRVPEGFSTDELPALKQIGQWGRIDDIHVRPWKKAQHEVVIHFFRGGGKIEDSQRVITERLGFDQIFDVSAGLSGQPGQPALFFRDLLPFLHERLKASFGGIYTLEDPSPPAPFYITSGGLGDNFYLPEPWQALINSPHARSRSDADLGVVVNRVYVDNRTEENAVAIFRPGKKP